MTYRELCKKLLSDLTDEQLDQDVTIFDGEEYHSADITFGPSAYDDVLDKGHMFLSF